MSARDLTRIIKLEGEMHNLQIQRDKSLDVEEWIRINLKYKYYKRMYEMARRLYTEEREEPQTYPISTFNSEVRDTI